MMIVVVDNIVTRRNHTSGFNLRLALLICCVAIERQRTSYTGEEAHHQQEQRGGRQRNPGHSRRQGMSVEGGRRRFRTVVGSPLVLFFRSEEHAWIRWLLLQRKMAMKLGWL
jgi:hypothetical protein